MTCYPYRKLWVKEIVGEDSRGRPIFADAEELRLEGEEAETGDCRGEHGPRLLAAFSGVS
jgi:hypothetical protein